MSTRASLIIKKLKYNDLRVRIEATAVAFTLGRSPTAPRRPQLLGHCILYPSEVLSCASSLFYVHSRIHGFKPTTMQCKLFNV